MKSKYLKLSLLILLLLPINGCIYMGGPWKGKVLDVETKQPIEGTVVLMFWYRQLLTPFGRDSSFYDAREAVTDKAGEFRLPWYFTISLIPLIAYVDEPEFIVFKPGYGSLHLRLGDYLAYENEKMKVNEFELFGKKYRLTPGVVELPQLKTKEERKFTKPAPIGDENEWKKQKLFIKAIREEWGYLTDKDPGNLYLIKEDRK
jgi:hypothetical protein